MAEWYVFLRVNWGSSGAFLSTGESFFIALVFSFGTFLGACVVVDDKSKK